MTGLDVGMEEKVGAKPSGTKLGAIPHWNLAGKFGAKWAVAAGMVEVTTSEITVLAGGVGAVGEACLWEARTDSIMAVNQTISSFSSLFSCSRCSMIL